MTPEPSDGSASHITLFGKIEIAEAEVRRLSSAALVDRLVAGGVSRLTAARMVEIERGGDECGRARPHANARR